MSEMFPGQVLQQANTQTAGSPNGCVNLRDRIKACLVVEDDADQQAPEETLHRSPSDAFFGWPNRVANQINAQQEPGAHHQKRRQVLKGFEKLEVPQIPQHHRPTLSELQATESPLAKTLIGKPASTDSATEHDRPGQLTKYLDRVTASRDVIYKGAIDRLVAAKRNLEQTFANATAEDDRLFDFLDASHKKTAKPLSETRINDHCVGAQIHIGERVVAFNELIDTLEAEITSLWDQWESAQKEVNNIFAELTHERIGAERDQPDSMLAVRESLAREVYNFEEELGVILKEAHEEARVSEKVWCRC